ncbi:MAG TPA: GNAT family N-acetyltransferase [Myxococcales bacterium]|nr:GNAT family N-acetyltransferase [Myxococcales bacterium]
MIRPATADELPLVSELAGRIWRAHYPAIIGSAQVEYMLAWMYDVAQLRRDVERGVVYELLLEGGRAVGFCGYEPIGRELKLHKLYLEVSEHGRGLGSQMLKHVEDQARRRGLPTVVLGVNRGNAKAIRAYERNGYRVRQELKTDIGGGFVMDDFIMEKQV